MLYTVQVHYADWTKTEGRTDRWDKNAKSGDEEKKEEEEEVDNNLSNV
jgi:hypothetical protein